MSLSSIVLQRLPLRFDKISPDEMYELKRETSDFELINRSALTLLPEILGVSSNLPRRFNLRHQNNQSNLIDYLLDKPLPKLIIQIIGHNYEQTRQQFRASIDEAFRNALRKMMEQTNIWLWNGTRSMVDFTDLTDIVVDEDSINSFSCETFGKSQLLIYSRTLNEQAENIFSRIKQRNELQEIPVVSLLIHGDRSSVTTIVENFNHNLPTIIIRGTGALANELADFYQSFDHVPLNERSSRGKRNLLAEVDYQQLRESMTIQPSLVFVCQPGRDALDESILRAIESARRRVSDSSHVHIEQFFFAMQWNLLDYVELHVLNHETIIEWTNEELDKCLEMAIRFNAVSFVELLFDYGASLKRLALINHANEFTTTTASRNSIAKIMVDSLPVAAIVDDEMQIRIYIQQIFHWAVENQHFDLVMSICTRLEDSVVGILLAHQWCQYIEDNSYVVSSTYRKHRQQFDVYAADILDLLYEDNEENTLKWLNDKSVVYHNQHAAALIDDLSPKEVLSTKCMQAYMSKRWYGEQFHQEKNFTWGFLICVVCLCPLLLFIPAVRDRVFQWDSIKKPQHSKDTVGKRFSHPFEPLRQFYQKNIVIRFRYNLVSYTSFLVLFSYTILFNYFPLNVYKENRSNIYRLPIPITEILVHVFLGAIALEELQQVYRHVKSILSDEPYWKELSTSKLHTNSVWSYYRDDHWNVLDFAAFTLWIIGFVTRFIVRETLFEISKICMSLDLCLWYMRCLHVFLASEQLGAKLLMIFNTMKDLVLYLFFIFIFLCAYTITTYSLISTTSFVLWSNETHFTTIQNGGNLTNFEILRNILEWGVWRIFGSTSLTTSDLMEVKYSAKNDSYGFVTLLLTITFLIVVYVLLLNNLIALFNFTIQRVHVESHRAWCNHFHVMLKEYEEKDLLVPPFNLLLWPVGCFLKRKLDRHVKHDTLSHKTSEERGRIRRHQQRIAEQYWRNHRQKDKDSIIQRTFVCRHCRSRGTESDYIESTSL